MPFRFVIQVIVILLLCGNSIHAKVDKSNLLNQFEKTETNITFQKSESFGEVKFFNGIDSNFELINKDTISGQFTFCAWIKPEDLLKKNMAIVGIPNIFWFRTTTTRELQFTQPSIVDNNTEGLLLSNKNWVFASLVIDFPDVKIYLNGKLSAQFKWKGKNHKWTNNIFIGKNHWQEFFHGSMHDIVLYEYAATQNQITELYRKTVKSISLTDGIVFYHPLDNKNKFYNQGNLSESKNVTFPNDSLRGKVAHFPGKDGYLDFGILPIDNAVTISTWIKPSVFNRDYGAIAAFGHAFAFRLTTGGALLFTIPQMADIPDSSAKLELNKWQHIAVTFKEGLGVSFFLNGEKKSFNSQSEFQNVIKELKVGTNLWNDFFNGQLDDLIIWDRILSDSEVKEVYNAPANYWHPVLKQSKRPATFHYIFFVVLAFLPVFGFILLKRKSSSAKAEINRSNPFLEKVNLVVDQNLSDSEFTVDRFAQELFVSKTKLYNELKKFTGKSPKEYIREQRLVKAAMLLKETDKPIADISFETGFESRAYFNKCFKERYKATPTSYRNIQT